MNPTTRLHRAGQSLWLDHIDRGLLASGKLQRYIDELSVTGLTSNPTIYHKAISQSEAYDQRIREGHESGLSSEDIFFSLAIDDLQQAADVFKAIHERSSGVDGFVSLEVSPLLADDTEGTIEQAKRLHAQAQRPNLFIKIPGTPAGLPAIEEATFAGVPVNVTLLFTVDHYLAAADAYMRGLERRIEADLDAAVQSVASVFLSRWDVAVADDVAPESRNRLGSCRRPRRLSRLPRTPRQRSLATTGQPWRAGAATAVREHRDQGSRRTGHLVRIRLRVAQHGQHLARGNAACLRRPWRGAGDAAAGRW